MNLRDQLARTACYLLVYFPLAILIMPQSWWDAIVRFFA